jgi:lactoylglutathione lyase
MSDPDRKGAIQRRCCRRAELRALCACALLPQEALAFYERLFGFELRGKSDSMAFIDLGDQFIALERGRKQPSDDGRHFGLVVDDKEAAGRALRAAGIEQIAEPLLNFRDAWGNRIEIVDYATVQFTKAPNVLHGMGLDHLSKSESARQQLTKKGMGGAV